MSSVRDDKLCVRKKSKTQENNHCDLGVCTAPQIVTKENAKDLLVSYI